MDGNDVGVIILSGGNSFRMGYPKAFLKLGAEPLIKILSDIYTNFGIKRPIIVLNNNLYTIEWTDYITALSVNNTVLKNHFPELGRTHSIQLGIRELKNKTICFIQNIDNPEISVELLKNMLSQLKKDNYVVASNNSINGHPILLGKLVVNYLKKLKRSNWILKDELKKFNKTQVEAATSNVLLNLNTIEDWNNYTEAIKNKSAQLT